MDGYLGVLLEHLVHTSVRYCDGVTKSGHGFGVIVTDGKSSLDGSCR